MTKHKHIFISGLHRSATSVLHEVLKEQNEISGFSDTGVPEDEGQLIQTVYNPASYYGGPGKFAFNSKAHYTEKSEFISDKNRDKLLLEWGKYWDFSKPYLIEKSPPNLIRTRFLQTLFPNSYFITIQRHPIAVSYATQNWTKQSLSDLIKHWIVAHEIHNKDRVYLKNEFVIKYEELIANPELVLESLGEFLGLEINYKGQFKNSNTKYFNKWNAGRFNPFKNIQKQKLINAYETKLNTFGYSLVDLDNH